MSKSLVTADWLKDNLGDVLVVDAGYHLPAANRDAAAEFEAGHIKGAVRFDIDEIADKSSGLPHMLPSKSAFESAMRGLGIDDDTHVVAYDDFGPEVGGAPLVDASAISAMSVCPCLTADLQPGAP